MGTAFKAAAAGAAAVWIMDRYDWFAFNHEDPQARRLTEAVRPGGMDPAHALAKKFATAAGRHLEPAAPHRHSAGLTVHYVVPMGLAICYEALRHQVPAISKGRGALYGLGIFLILDEVINPVLGLAASPAKYPWQRHAREMAAHVIYGMAIHTMLDFADRNRTR